MTGTVTARLGLYKPDPDDDVTVETDINDNYDKLDSLFPPTVCTSGTRPTTPFVGQLIYENDTNRLVVRTSDGKWTTITGRTMPPDVKITADVAVTNSDGNTIANVGNLIAHLAIPCDGQATHVLTASFGGFRSNNSGGTPTDADGTDSMILAIERYTAGVATGRIQVLMWMWRGADVGGSYPSAGGTMTVEHTPPPGTWDYRLRAWRYRGNKNFNIDASATYPIRFAIVEKPGAKY